VGLRRAAGLDHRLRVTADTAVRTCTLAAVPAVVRAELVEVARVRRAIPVGVDLLVRVGVEQDGRLAALLLAPERLVRAVSGVRLPDAGTGAVADAEAAVAVRIPVALHVPAPRAGAVLRVALRREAVDLPGAVEPHLEVAVGRLGALVAGELVVHEADAGAGPLGRVDPVEAVPVCAETGDGPVADHLA